MNPLDDPAQVAQLEPTIPLGAASACPRTSPT